MLISKEAILLQLFKKVRGGGKTSLPPMNQPTTFHGLGHYNLVQMFPCQSSSALVSQSTKNQRVEFEKLVLIPATDTKLEINALFGIVSIILTDEEDQDPFATALSIEKEFQTAYQSINKEYPSDFLPKAFVSTSTASVAVISFCDDPKHVVDWMETYFGLLQKICLEKRETCIYSFSIPLVSTIKTDADKNKDLFDSLRESKDKFPAILFTFARNFEDARNFDKFIDNFVVALSVPQSQIIKGTINGADDYQIVAKDVPSYSFFYLFSPGNFMNPLDGKGDFSYYDSSFTTILLPVRNQYKISLNDSPQEKIVSGSEINEQNSLFSQLPELAGVKYYYDTFVALKQSRFTKWVYSIYRPYVALMENLLKEHLDWVEDTQESLKNSITFFTAMFEMIESLLSTSTSYTKSPGFRKIEINIVPRLILSYQSIIQHYAGYWNEKENENWNYPERRRLFLLTPHMGKDLRSEIFFSNLPPGEQLVKIRLPIVYALRPTTCLPVLFHEVGHFIGVRHRSNGRIDSFLILVVQLIIQSISEKFYSQHIDESSDPEAEEYDFNNLLSGDSGTSKQKFIFSNLTLLLFEFGNVLYGSLRSIYEEIKYAVLEEYQEKINKSKEDVTKDILERKKSALEIDNFSEVVPTIETILKECMGEEFLDDFFEDTESRFSELIWDGILSRTMIEAAEKQLMYIFTHVLEGVQFDIGLKDSHRNFIKKAASILSEISSDIFMIKTLDMSSIDYLLLHFELLLASYGKDGIITSIAKFGTSEIDNLRILAVYSVLEKNNSEVASKWYIENYLQTIESAGVDISKKVSLFYSFEKAVKSALTKYVDLKEYSESLDNGAWKNEPYSAVEMTQKMNPFYGVHKYAEQLYNDARYDQQETKVKDLRDLYSLAKKEIKSESEVSDLYKNLFSLAFRLANEYPG